MRALLGRNLSVAFLKCGRYTEKLEPHASSGHSANIGHNYYYGLTLESAVSNRSFFRHCKAKAGGCIQYLHQVCLGAAAQTISWKTIHFIVLDEVL